MKLLYLLNDFLKINPIFPNFKNKKFFLFCTASLKTCEELIKIELKHANQIDVLTNKKIQIKSANKLNLFYYNSAMLDKASFNIKKIKKEKYDYVIIPFNSNNEDECKAYKSIIKLARKIKAKKILGYTYNKDFFEINSFYFLKEILRNIAGRSVL